LTRFFFISLIFSIPYFVTFVVFDAVCDYCTTTRRTKWGTSEWIQSEIWAQFHQRSTYSFYTRRSQKRKKILTTLLTLTLLGTTLVKSASKYVGEINPWTSLQFFISFRKYNFWIFVCLFLGFVKKSDQLNPECSFWTDLRIYYIF